MIIIFNSIMGQLRINGLYKFEYFVSFLSISIDLILKLVCSVYHHPYTKKQLEFMLFLFICGMKE